MFSFSQLRLEESSSSSESVEDEEEVAASSHSTPLDSSESNFDTARSSEESLPFNSAQEEETGTSTKSPEENLPKEPHQISDKQAWKEFHV